MTRTARPLRSCSQLRTPRESLAAWPGVLARLERERTFAQRPGEDTLALENRVGTRLMALYRDTRETEPFEALYAFTGESVLSWIRSLLTRDLAHLDPLELLQDTFVNVYRYPGAFREDHPRSFRVWVRTIAGNVLRRQSSRRVSIPTLELSTDTSEPADRRAGPLLVAQTDEELMHLRSSWMLFLHLYQHAYQTLSARDKQTLELVEIQGLSYREAGEILGVGRSNMKMIVFRSRKRIARRMRQAMNAAVCRPKEELGAA